MIESNTLYYTFSTIPQVLGAFVALLAVFVHFRLVILQDYLVGDGKSILNRLGNTGVTLDDMQQKRLKDAVDRKNIYEIKAIIKLLSDNEKEEGFTKQQRPTGLQYAFEDRFCGTEIQIQNLKNNTLITCAVALVTIALSLISLSLTDLLLICNYYSIISLIVNMLLALATLILSFKVIYQGLIEKTLHETDRI